MVSPGGFGEITGESGKHIGGDVNQPQAIWRLLSGMSHGDIWASHTMTDRDEISVNAEGDVVTLLTTSSVTNVATFTKIVLNMTRIAVGIYDQRSRPLWAD